MNLRTSGLLLLVVVTLGGLWYATAGGGVGGGAGQGAAAPGAGVPLFPSSPLALRIERSGGARVLRREGGFWSQVSPAWFPLGEEAGREIARALSGAVVSESFEPGSVEAIGSGIDPANPAARVEVVGAEGVTRVALGESLPGGRSYARVEESPDPTLKGRVVVLPEGLHGFAFARWDGGRFDPVLPLPPLDAVVSMTLQGEEERVGVELIRDGPGWRLTDDGAPVREERIEELARLTEGIATREFLVDARSTAGLGVYGLKSPTAIWTLREEGGRETVLALGRSGGLGDDSLYGRMERQDGDARLTSPILRLPPAVGFLREGRDRLADPRPLPIEPATVRSVTFELPGEPPRIVFDEANPPNGDGAGFPLASLAGLTGERRIRPPDRVYDSVEPGDEPAPPGEEPRPRGYRGRWIVDHGPMGRSEGLLIRRRQGWVIRLAGDQERVEYLLDEPSERVLEEDLLSWFAPAG